MFILQAITTGEILAQFQIFFAEIHFPLLKKSSDSPGQIFGANDRYLQSFFKIAPSFSPSFTML